MGSTWMTDLPEKLTKLPLRELAIPGSHDSGAYDLTDDLSPSASATIKALEFLPGFNTILLDMATTQSLNMGQQLEMGIRYLDLRIDVRPQKQDFYFVHTAFGTRVKIALEAINTFLDKNPREVLILHLQKFNDMDAQKHKDFIAMLKNVFKNKFLPKTELNLQDLSLNTCWQQGKQIICIYIHAEAETDDILWSSTCIVSPWPDTSSDEECIKKLDQYMDEAAIVTDQFYVAQGILTPSISYVLKHCTTSLHKMTTKFTPMFNKWLLGTPTKYKNQPNIVIKDFIQDGNFIANVLSLNKNRE